MGAKKWHRRGLEAAAGPGPHAEERRRYHGAWLAYLEDPAAPPRVTVVMPAYEAGRWIRQSVESALGQTYPNVDVIVVDDGSTRPAAADLDGLGARLQVLRCANAGPAAARNLGVERAAGVLIHFLDADDVMEAGAIEAKVEALRSIPDADLCFSDYHVAGSDERRVREHVAPPIRGEHCATRGLLEAATRRFVFQPSTVLAARWLLRRAGPFDPRLRQAEDGRCWFVLGSLGAKAIAVDLPLVTRRLHPGGLSTDREARLPWWGATGLMCLADLLSEPEWWPLVGLRLNRFHSPDLWRATCRSSLPVLAAARADTLEAIAALPRIAAEANRSAAPVAAVLVDHLSRRLDSDGSEFQAAALAASRAALTAGAARPGRPERHRGSRSR